MDLEDIAQKYGHSRNEVNQVVEQARRSLVPIVQTFEVTEAGQTSGVQVERQGVGPIDTPFGPFHQFAFKVGDRWSKYTVLYRGDLSDRFMPVLQDPSQLLLRIDSGCETGQLFLDVTCECRQQLHLAMATIRDAGEGMIIHIPLQDGRGLRLPFKLATLRIQAELGVDTVESSLMLKPDGDRDERTFAGVLALLKFLDISPQTLLRLMSNNPRKLVVFNENGYKVSVVPAVVEPTEHTRRHLHAKQEHLGHSGLVPLGSSVTERLSAPQLSGRLKDLISSRNTRVCCGLDPDVLRLPDEYRSDDPEAVLGFLLEAINLTHSHVIAYKLQKAFFEAIPRGFDVLREAIAHIRSQSADTLIILDCKVGDIDNTMRAYYRAYLDELAVDAVVLNPYMGSDVWSGLKSYPNQSGFVLVRTSNDSARTFQELTVADGRRLWQVVLDIVLEEWRAGNDLMPVICSNSPIPEESARKIVSAEVPTLIAGAGAQGGSYANVRSVLASGLAFVTSSRSLTFPFEPNDLEWRGAIERSIEAMRNELNEAARQSCV